MRVMPANNSKWQVHFWQGKWGGLGHLYSPGERKGPYPHLPYALDNGAFPAWTSGRAWYEESWWQHAMWYLQQDQSPLWLLVPDVVADRDGTIARWNHYEPRLRSNGQLPCDLAFAVQDGMQPSDVPKGAGVVFVGGTTNWKWDTVEMWCAEFPRVHVGRVNGYADLVRCHQAGAESCDGTGWFRGDRKQLAGLQQFLREQATCVNDITLGNTMRKTTELPCGYVQATFLPNTEWTARGVPE